MKQSSEHAGRTRPSPWWRVALVTAGVLASVALGRSAFVHRPTATQRSAVGSYRHAGPGMPIGSSASALAAAGRFAVVWWSYDWREPVGARLARIDPLVTAPLAALLGGGPGSPALWQAARSARRRVVVGHPSVTIADRARAGLGLAVTAPVTVSAAGSHPVAGRWAMEVLAVPSGGRWVVAQVDQ